MKTRVAINGFGRIGRNAFKIAFDRSDVEIVAINDLTDTKTLSYLLQHDSSYGTYSHKVTFDEANIIVDDTKIPVSAEKDPTKLPWKQSKVDVVIESTGRFTKREDAAQHLTAGAKKVVISAPTKSVDIDTLVMGANEENIEHAGDIVSNASCTTNSVAAIMAIMDEAFGIEKAMLTTVHSYTASQVLQDGPAKDLREARAAAENIVPTTTGAAIAVTLALPQLKDKFDGMSIRVPSPVVSLSDVTLLLSRDTTKEDINKTFKKAVKEPYFQGILDVSEEPLVSKDYVGNSHSGIVDLLLTNVVGGNLAKVVVWYDNEWGYSNRLVEVVADLGQILQKANTTAAPSTQSSPTASSTPEPIQPTTFETTPPTPEAELKAEPIPLPEPASKKVIQPISDPSSLVAPETTPSEEPVSTPSIEPAYPPEATTTAVEAPPTVEPNQSQSSSAGEPPANNQRL